MHYVKQFSINGVDTKQVACIELKGKPNTATEGAVGLLGIDMSSPLHEIYKCVAVNGSIYTWELFSSGMSIVSASMSGGGEKSVQFPYDSLKTPSGYIVKIGDLILDNEGYLYFIDSLNATYCGASYCGTRVVAYGMSAYDLAVEEGFEGTIDDWLATLKGEPGDTFETMECGSYVGTGTSGASNPNRLTFGFVPKLVIVRRAKLTKDYEDGHRHSTEYYSDDAKNTFIWMPGLERSGTSEYDYRYYTRSGKTLSWYATLGGSDIQFNQSGYSDDGSDTPQTLIHTYTYTYVAFG